jgi:hypothetical protein
MIKAKRMQAAAKLGGCRTPAVLFVAASFIA